MVLPAEHAPMTLALLIEYKHKKRYHFMEECIVCFEEKEPIAFPCGHKVCIVCYPKLTRCPLCNYEVVVYLPTTPVSHTQVTRYTLDRDVRSLQVIFCFILLGIILLALHKWH